MVKLEGRLDVQLLVLKPMFASLYHVTSNMFILSLQSNSYHPMMVTQSVWYTFALKKEGILLAGLGVKSRWSRPLPNSTKMMWNRVLVTVSLSYLLLFGWLYSTWLKTLKVSTSSEILGFQLGYGLLILATRAWDQTWLGVMGIKSESLRNMSEILSKDRIGNTDGVGCSHLIIIQSVFQSNLQ